MWILLSLGWGRDTVGRISEPVPLAKWGTKGHRGRRRLASGGTQPPAPTVTGSPVCGEWSCGDAGLWFSLRTPSPTTEAPFPRASLAVSW